MVYKTANSERPVRDGRKSTMARGAGDFLCQRRVSKRLPPKMEVVKRLSCSLGHEALTQIQHL
jgi:hypothetical protein